MAYGDASYDGFQEGHERSAWFMCMRLREALAPAKAGPIGGENKVVEADETFIGGKKKNRAFAKKEPKKQVVLALVDRDGESRSPYRGCERENASREDRHDHDPQVTSNDR
jgi:hypothetical protein